MNIKCVETGKVYITTTCAAEDTAANQSSISKCCNGKRNKTGGLHWEYTDDPVTEKRQCVCGNWFMPTKGKMTFCCDECRRKAYKYDMPRAANIKDREFTFNTNILLVQEYERHGNVKRMADGYGLPEKMFYDQLIKLKENGQYALIKKLLNIQSTLQNHEVGVRIA